ncbi:MAG: glycerol-3-phosphate ABC transporter ATP-binding protein [Chlorobiaceae bacterium]|nr:glycerol-3-phosphate ABC transporter ATP-binding protein [Chlorobiaceae bacterium]MBA4308923.1 glycerol-3-phosphate ABC transporter ATP-binding protein [Chlorobiaceae bacterium]
MAEVKLLNVGKVYEGGNVAVKDVSIEIKDKEFVVLVGPSGCGKSTTLRMIAGLEEITEGELFIDGKKVNDVSPKDRDIAMVFQNYALYPHMSVYENMAFGLKLRKFSKDEIDKRVKEAAKILSLEDYLERKPKALSGGQRQRVAVGRAIVRKPKVFLFDEPLSNLDAKLRVQMRTEISKLHHSLEATMIYVTHDQTEAMTMGDRIVIMKDGIVHQVDTPLNLYNHPSNRFVAGFIGSPSMNFVEGKIIQNNGLEFQSNNKKLEIPVSKNPERLKNHVNKKVWLGIRPEDIFEFSSRPDSNNLNEVNTKLEVVEPMGNEIFLYFVIEGEQFTSRIPAREKPNAGSNINLYFDSSKLHFFDFETEVVL